jgi:hypothetical protein
MDRIVKSLVEDLLKTQEIKSENLSKDFERFVNYSVISTEYLKSFDIEDTMTGEGDDTGIDGIAIMVNGKLIENKEDIDFLLENNNFLESTFIFVEAKTSNAFESSEINNFAFGVKDFFSEHPKLRRNLEIQNFAEISDYLFTKASQFRENPKCKLYYVSNGMWKEDQNNIAIVESTKDDLEKTNLFAAIEFKLLGANEISKLYRTTQNAVTTTFVFNSKVTLPELPNITEAYLGILPLSEFNKILCDENGNMRNVFYDNVRDYQGIENPVNTSILKTLKSDYVELFTVLNNGVTIVASSLKPSGNKFTISDYQIVNGCQTSNVLYNFIKENDIGKVNLPIKLVITENDEIKNNIIIATNNQTAIKREQLQAMTEFQKNLEHYYRTIEGDGKLYYERRSGQYQSDNSVIKARIINIQNQIKAFSSMYYENPDRVTTYFGSIVKQNIETENPIIFNPGHQHILYYTSALAFYRLDSLFRSKAIDAKFRKVKFFLLMLFRKLIKKSKLAAAYMNSDRKTSEYCKEIMDILNDKDKTLEFFQKAIEIVRLSKEDIENKQLIKQVQFTTKLLEAYDKHTSSNQT